MKKQSFFLGWFWLAVAVPLLLFLQRAQATPIGENRPYTCDTCTCAGSCATPSPCTAVTVDAYILRISLTEGNLSESLDLSRTLSSTGATLSFSAVYNSYNADGSRAQVDTVMGYGWTHSYNIFLFSQFGSMFRYDGRGRVTRYGLGPGANFHRRHRLFRNAGQNNDGTFTITQKDKTVFTFASIPNTPFLVEGPVWRLTSIVDRNGNTTTLTYTNGDLTSVTDTYGRSMTLTYNAQNKLASVTDPAGRVTTFQYDSTGQQLTQDHRPHRQSIQYSYNFLYQLTGKIDKDGRTFSYVYATTSRLPCKDSSGTARPTLSNPNNWATDSTQLAMNQLRVYLPSTTTDTDGRGNAWQYQYDANGYITKTIAPDGATATYTYDPATLHAGHHDRCRRPHHQLSIRRRGKPDPDDRCSRPRDDLYLRAGLQHDDQHDGPAGPRHHVHLRRPRQPHPGDRSAGSNPQTGPTILTAMS